MHDTVRMNDSKQGNVAYLQLDAAKVDETLGCVLSYVSACRKIQRHIFKQLLQIDTNTVEH